MATHALAAGPDGPGAGGGLVTAALLFLGSGLALFALPEVFELGAAAPSMPVLGAGLAGATLLGAGLAASAVLPAGAPPEADPRADGSTRTRASPARRPG